MNLRQKQAREYLDEAELTLVSARAIFDKAKESGLELWSHVVKSFYDAMEQAISSALASNDKTIPKDHSAKVTSFINTSKPPKNIREILLHWLGKRGTAQYIDIKGDEVVVPHEMFDEDVP